MNAPTIGKLEGFGLPEPKFETYWKLEHLAPAIGTIVHGIDLSRPLGEDEAAELRNLLVERKVIFFRDQDITTEQHLAFARNFGDLEVHPFAPHKPDFPEVLAITHNEKSKGRENGWHSDVTWRAEPSLGSVLHALKVPAVGGDTLFANMETAYDHLPDEVKEKLEGAVAIHDFNHFRTALKKRGATEAEIEEFNKTYPMVEHPVIRTHPESGRKSIYVNAAFTLRIKGWEEAESDAMLRYLYAQASFPEYQCRFKWAPHSIAFWDNRAAQHYAASDYWPAERIVERVTIIGDRPR